MSHKGLALIALVRIRGAVSVSYRRQLNASELRGLQKAVELLTQSVTGDAQALQKARWLEDDLQPELSGDWPGCNELRVNVMINAHELSGYLMGL
ncbi:MAG: hypothetical protein JWO94_3754 [Verrucomicrobiaceae bacterium]|nr:hypothetical protein [Verrucomicrobiaceae bacterium]